MIILLWAAANLAAQPLPKQAVQSTILVDAGSAIEAGRLDQGRLMIGRAMAAGFAGPPVDRLIAQLDFASGDYAQALARYERLIASSGRQPRDCEYAARAALKIGRIATAKPLIDCATAQGASWRAWNVRGAYADLTGDWAMADEAYDRARQLAPDEAEVINNQGWSQLLRGNWQRAEALLKEAAARDPKAERIANNLELATAALAADLPRRLRGEPGSDWAARLNDAGAAAALLGQKARAVAAFSQALEADGTWYARAANNLEAVSRP